MPSAPRPKNNDPLFLERPRAAIGTLAISAPIRRAPLALKHLMIR
jgi:hypothetical protein